MIIDVTRHNFETEIKNSKKPVVIDVFATWCGPCQHMEPFYEELAQELGSKYTFGKLNIDEARDIAIEFGIMSVPTFLFLKNGTLVGQEIGYMSKEQLKETIESHLG
jgi:thioredoxin 1